MNDEFLFLSHIYWLYNNRESQSNELATYDKRIGKDIQDECSAYEKLILSHIGSILNTGFGFQLPSYPTY